VAIFGFLSWFGSLNLFLNDNRRRKTHLDADQKNQYPTRNAQQGDRFRQVAGIRGRTPPNTLLDIRLSLGVMGCLQ
jgi:hypothetical protein